MAEDLVVLGPDVKVRAAPSSDAEVVARLSWAVVRLASRPPGVGDAWVEVKPDGDRRGFVAADDVRRPIDYRAVFTRSANAWRMTTFIAGD